MGLKPEKTFNTIISVTQCSQITDTTDTRYKRKQHQWYNQHFQGTDKHRTDNKKRPLTIYSLMKDPSLFIPLKLTARAISIPAIIPTKTLTVKFIPFPFFSCHKAPIEENTGSIEQWFLITAR